MKKVRLWCFRAGVVQRVFLAAGTAVAERGAVLAFCLDLVCLAD